MTTALSQPHLIKRHFRDQDYDKPAIHNLGLDNVTGDFTKITAQEAMPSLSVPISEGSVMF